jgi:CRP-like cAMP-binding protein
MPRIEVLYPQLKKGTWNVNPMSIVFKAEGEILTAELPHETKPIIKLLNGSYALSEIVKTLFFKKINIRFQLIIEILRVLSRKNLFANNKQVLIALEQFDSNTMTPKQIDIQDHTYFTRDILKGLIQKTPLAPRSHTNDLEAILSHSKVITVQEQEMLIKKGSVGDKAYLLLSGSLGVYLVNEKGHTDCVAVMADLSLFGESSAILGKERMANVVAHENSWVLEVNIKNVIDINNADNDYTSLKSLKTRLLINQILITAPIFSGLPTDVMQLFTTQCELETFDANEVIIYQNDHLNDSSVFLRPNIDDHSFYFLLKGDVEILKNGKHICNLEKGSYFGEVGALNELTRTASVRTNTTCHLLKLEAQALNEVLSVNFKLAIKMEEVADARTKESLETLETMEIDDKTKEVDLSEITHSTTRFNLEDSLIDIESIEPVDFK